MSRNLDYLRSCAVLAVYFSHLLTVKLGHFPGIWQLGRFGVLIFFVHTALVLMQSLERSGKRPRFYLVFYVRRLFRIFPLAIVCIFTVLVFRIPEGPGLVWRAFSVRDIVANLALSQNLVLGRNVIGPLWSLPLEVQMYVILPVFFVVLMSVRRCWLALGVATLLGLAQPAVSARANLLAFAPCFIAGILAFRLTENRRLPGWLWVVTVPVISVVFCAVNFWQHRAAWTTWVLCVSLGILIPRFREIRSASISRTAELVAKYSYGIYLSHVPLMWLAFNSGVISSGAAQYLVLAAGSVFVPVVLYHLIEHPLIAAGGKLASRFYNRNAFLSTPIIRSNESPS